MAYRGFSFKHGGTVASMWLCIQGFMQAIGWELYDDIASNIKVYRSNGESGNEHYGYVYMQQEATYIAYRFFQYWDLSAHVGYREQVMGGTTSQRLGTFNNTMECLLCGDKDIVAIIYPAESNTANSSIWFGHIPNRFDRVTYADGTAGTSATISVASTSGLYEGKQIQILGAGTEGCENLDIIEMVDASTVIVRKMSKDYGTGAVIGVPASTFGCANPYAAAQRWYPTTHISDLGTAVQSQYYNIYALMTPAVATVQHHFSKKGAPGPLYFVSDSAGTTGCMVGFLLKYFLYARNVSQTWDACIYNTSGEYGTSATASTSSANTLIETGRTWSADQHLNRMVLITAGTNIGQCAKITGNDATSLSIDGTWGTTFGTSRYQICDQLFRAQRFSLYINLQLRVTDTTAPVLT